MYRVEYEEWLRGEGRAKNTIKVYLNEVEEFSRWYEEKTGREMDPKWIASQDLHDYVEHLQDEKKKPTTVNKKIASLKTYWKFLLETEKVETNPTRKLKMKNLSSLQDEPRSLGRWERKYFLDLLDSDIIDKNEWKRKRNRAMARLMLQAGLRVSEVASLDLDDLKNLTRRGEETVYIRNSKRDRDREVELNRDVVKALKEWLKIREEKIRSGEKVPKPGHENALFLSHYKVRISERSIQDAMDKYLRRAGVRVGSCHVLRHTAPIAQSALI